MADPGKIGDIVLAPPAPRLTTPKATSDQLVTVTLAAILNAKAARQHRDILIEIGKLTVPADVADLGITANVTYSQSQLQTVIDKIDELAQTQRQILEIVRSIVDLSTAKILTVGAQE